MQLEATLTNITVLLRKFDSFYVVNIYIHIYKCVLYIHNYTGKYGSYQLGLPIAQIDFDVLEYALRYAPGVIHADTYCHI